MQKIDTLLNAQKELLCAEKLGKQIKARAKYICQTISSLGIPISDTIIHSFQDGVLQIEANNAAELTCIRQSLPEIQKLLKQSQYFTELKRIKLILRP